MVSELAQDTYHLDLAPGSYAVTATAIYGRGLTRNLDRLVDVSQDAHEHFVFPAPTSIWIDVPEAGSIEAIAASDVRPFERQRRCGLGYTNVPWWGDRVTLPVEAGSQAVDGLSPGREWWVALSSESGTSSALISGSGTLPQPKPHVALTGTLRGVDGRPCAGTVYVIPSGIWQDRLTRDDQAMWPREGVRVGPDGLFKLPALPQEDWMVIALPPETGRVRGDSGLPRPTAARPARAERQVRPGRDRTVSLRLAETRRVLLSTPYTRLHVVGPPGVSVMASGSAWEVSGLLPGDEATFHAWDDAETLEVTQIGSGSPVTERVQLATLSGHVSGLIRPALLILSSAADASLDRMEVYFRRRPTPRGEPNLTNLTLRHEIHTDEHGGFGPIRLAPGEWTIRWALSRNLVGQSITLTSGQSLDWSLTTTPN